MFVDKIQVLFEDSPREDRFIMFNEDGFKNPELKAVFGEAQFTNYNRVFVVKLF